MKRLASIILACAGLSGCATQTPMAKGMEVAMPALFGGYSPALGGYAAPREKQPTGFDTFFAR